LQGKRIIKISCMNMCCHALALAADKSVYTWGSNSRGILGLGYNSNAVPTPTEIVFLRDKNVVHIVASGYTDDSSSFAITADHQLYAWGYDSYNRLLPRNYI
jgi:alpha-tubulin suppressor-like RCC1 family protein